MNTEELQTAENIFRVKGRAGVEWAVTQVLHLDIVPDGEYFLEKLIEIAEEFPEFQFLKNGRGPETASSIDSFITLLEKMLDETDTPERTASLHGRFLAGPGHVFSKQIQNSPQAGKRWKEYLQYLGTTAGDSLRTTGIYGGEVIL